MNKEYVDFKFQFAFYIKWFVSFLNVFIFLLERKESEFFFLVLLMMMMEEKKEKEPTDEELLTNAPLFC